MAVPTGVASGCFPQEARGSLPKALGFAASGSKGFWGSHGSFVTVLPTAAGASAYCRESMGQALYMYSVAQ